MTIRIVMIVEDDGESDCRAITRQQRILLVINYKVNPPPLWIPSIRRPIDLSRSSSPAADVALTTRQVEEDGHMIRTKVQANAYILQAGHVYQAF
jgi:hypothetical protein